MAHHALCKLRPVRTPQCHCDLRFVRLLFVGWCLNFPDSGGSGGGGIGDTSSVASNTATASNNIGPQLQGIVSQLANDIDSTKASIDTLTKSNADTQKTIQDLKNTNDRLYMIGLGGVGAGVAGIIMAAAALSRRNVLEVS